MSVIALLGARRAGGDLDRDRGADRDDDKADGEGGGGDASLHARSGPAALSQLNWDGPVREAVVSKRHVCQ